MGKKQEMNAVYVVRVFDSEGNLIPVLNAFRTRAGAEACIREWMPKVQKVTACIRERVPKVRTAEIVEVELSD